MTLRSNPPQAVGHRALHNKGLFVLLYDERNPTFCCEAPDGKRGIFTFLTSMLPTNIRSRVTSINIQELFHGILTSGRHDDWIYEFSEKYGLSAEKNII
jgi:hypothetical protein